MEITKNIDYKKTNAKEIIIQSIIFFGFVLLFWYLFTYRTITDFKSFWNLLLYANTYIIILLFNIHFLFGKLFLNKKYTFYILLTIFTFLIGYVTQQYIHAPSWSELYLSFKKDYNIYLVDWCINLLTFTMFGCVGLAFKLMLLWSKTKNEIIQLQNINLEIELKNLKNQISPHFLFNTLNNLYILTKTNSELASESILNLSDLIRYQLQTLTKEYVTIQEEIDYMKNLLQLEQLRRDNLKINYNLEIENYKLKIQPLILSTLIENAIKHGSQKLNECIIDINLTTYEQAINFKIVNSIPYEVSNVLNEESGLKNLRRRLDICYPENYNLILEKNSNSFSATLVLG